VSRMCLQEIVETSHCFFTGVFLEVLNLEAHHFPRVFSSPPEFGACLHHDIVTAQTRGAVKKLTPIKCLHLVFEEFLEKRQRFGQLAELYQSEGDTNKAKEIYAKLKDTDPKGVAGLTAAEKLNPPPAAAQRPPQPPQ